MITLFELNILKKIPLRIYLDYYILPIYDQFDKAHDRNHALIVADFAVKLAKKLKLDPDIAYASALLHDIGLKVNRETHHIESGKFVIDSNFLNLLFNYDEIEIIRHAVEDHRASSGQIPRNIYGKIIADSDRSDLVDLEGFITRSWKYREKMQSSHTDDEIFEDLYAHALTKLGKSGTIKFILPETEQLLSHELNRSKKIINNKQETYKIFLDMRKKNILKRIN